MVDVLTILFSHALLLLAAWRVMWRDDLDVGDEGDAGTKRPWLDGRERANDASDA